MKPLRFVLKYLSIFVYRKKAPQVIPYPHAHLVVPTCPTHVDPDAEFRNQALRIKLMLDHKSSVYTKQTKAFDVACATILEGTIQILNRRDRNRLKKQKAT